MKWALLDGADTDNLPPQWPEYVLCKAMGWTKTEYDEQPAAWCDWALQFLEMEGEVAEVQVQRASRG